MALSPPPSDDGTVGFRWMQWLHEVFKQVQTNSVSNYALEVARGNITGVASVNKFGRCPDNVDLGVSTDIWDGASAATATIIWVAPTQARTHTIVSTSTSDDGSPAGVGARTIRVYGLTDWGTNEVSEDITMDGTTGVTTSNSYVIIHRMRVLTKGATNTNVGTITATATTDTTLTAQINPGEGQTQMAIYGVPSTQKLYLSCYYASIQRNAGGSADIELLVNPEPDTQLTNFLVKHTNVVTSGGTSFIERNFEPYYEITGPALVKVQATGSANNMDVSAGFDGYLVNN